MIVVSEAGSISMKGDITEAEEASTTQTHVEDSPDDETNSPTGSRNIDEGSDSKKINSDSSNNLENDLENDLSNSSGLDKIPKLFWMILIGLAVVVVLAVVVGKWFT
jgi:hypothetical protein